VVAAGVVEPEIAVEADPRLSTSTTPFQKRSRKPRLLTSSKSFTGSSNVATRRTDTPKTSKKA
jgi:hypothetical protein